MTGRSLPWNDVRNRLLAAAWLTCLPACDFSTEPRDASSEPDIASEPDATDAAADPDPVSDPDPEVIDEPGDEVVVHLIADMTSTAQFFTWETTTAPPVDVRYFIVLGSDGDPRVAFDACDVCYRERLGYSQVGTMMRCNNCGNTYPIDGLGTENLGTGCWPGYLPVTITETEVVITHADLNAGAYRF